MDENISRAAGASHGQGMERGRLPRRWSSRSAAPLEQRTTLYGTPAIHGAQSEAALAQA